MFYNGDTFQLIDQGRAPLRLTWNQGILTRETTARPRQRREPARGARPSWPSLAPEGAGGVRACEGLPRPTNPASTTSRREVADRIAGPPRENKAGASPTIMPGGAREQDLSRPGRVGSPGLGARTPASGVHAGPWRAALAGAARSIQWSGAIPRPLLISGRCRRRGRTVAGGFCPPTARSVRSLVSPRRRPPSRRFRPAFPPSSRAAAGPPGGRPAWPS